MPKTKQGEETKTVDPEITNWVRIDGESLELSADATRAPGLSQRSSAWLSRLFQVDHVAILLGSGFTIGAAGLLGVDAPSMAKVNNFGEFQGKIDQRADVTAKTMGRNYGNLEDQLRAALELHTGLTILEEPKAADLLKAINEILLLLLRDILRTEREVSAKLDPPFEGEESEFKARRFLRVLQSFLLSFSGVPQPTKQRLEIFTTNYDRFAEFCCDQTGLRILDRFVGQIEPEFRSTRVGVDLHYNPPGIRGEPRYVEGVVRLSKLHGSIDWVHKVDRIVRQPLRFGGEPLQTTSLVDSLMVFPNAAKDIETAFFPYAELFRDMSAAVCRPNSTIVTYGYGYGDDHVNRVIRDMLSVAATHLVIISFDDPTGRIREFIQNLARPAQVTYLIGQEVASIDRLVEEYLPKPTLSAQVPARNIGVLSHAQLSVTKEPTLDESA